MFRAFVRTTLLATVSSSSVHESRRCTRRHWATPLLVVAALASTAALWAAAAESATASDATARPNLLLIVIDNVGYGDLGCYGNPINRTPRIDRLASEGVRMTQFYVGSPSCTPSRGALLTGRHPLRNGLNWQLKSEEQLGIGLPLDERMIPAYLEPLGYATAAFGKWNVGFAPGGRPLERGFDEYLGHASGNIDYYHHLYDHRLDTYRGNDNVRLEGYATDLWADATIDFIQRHADRPWFAYVPFNAVHIYNERNTPPGGKTEWQVPDKYLAEYGWPADEPDERRRYAAVLTALDHAVGRILDAVDAQGDRDQTLVLLISDNGAGHDRRTGGHVGDNAGLRSGITFVYEGGIRVPAMARWPGKIAAGTSSDQLLWSMDLLPTLVAAAGGTLTGEPVLDGIDILPVLAGAPAPQRDLCWEFRERRAIRRGNWKLVSPAQGAPWELYDLSSDAGETRDLAKLHPRLVTELSEAFATWRTATARPE